MDGQQNDEERIVDLMEVEKAIEKRVIMEEEPIWDELSWFYGMH